MAMNRQTAMADDAGVYGSIPGGNIAPAPVDDDDAPYQPFAPYADEADEPARKIVATPFVWRDPATIPRREWLYGRHLLRKFVSIDVAAGGLGKSSLKIGEALAMVTGRALYNKEIPQPLRVWIYNLEDPKDEIERRIYAVMQRFDISPENMGDGLFIDSGRDQPCVIAEDLGSGARIIRPVVDSIIEQIKAKRIDVLIIDPFVSSHNLSENDNRAMDAVIKEWGGIAEHGDCSVNLVHHVKKEGGIASTADSARGAKAVVDGARSVLVYNRMTKDEADAAGIKAHLARYYFRVDNDKANLAPIEATDWYRMNNEDLPNGDAVGVACRFDLPSLFEGVSKQQIYEMQKAVGNGTWWADVRASEWVGKAIAGALNMDPVTDRKRIARMLNAWIAEGVLDVVEGVDARRKSRKQVVVGRWLNDL